MHDDPIAAALSDAPCDGGEWCVCAVRWAIQLLRDAGLVDIEWAVVDRGQTIHLEGATCPADVMALTHGHGTHGPVGIARRTVIRTQWEEIR
ncbi:hypothetical protein ACFFOS_27465 [Nocardioides kongjuensis]|uniref:Uncharacterized protein n=1 Tax=Nocardioides kongjuensis TaxID=349522 RepID=A0A852RYG2_9ACTN|nr:hypothetical protein [Nocardioides kongjuensis]NYD33860.1 hypothetical protein [Nocardioides kongjuensis]